MTARHRRIERRRSAAGESRPVRTGGLRRQWHRAFAAVVVVLMLATGGISGAFLQVEDRYRGAAARLDYAVTVTSELTDRITQHQQDAQLLWNGITVDKGRYLAMQGGIEDLFSQATERLESDEQRTLLAGAREDWRTMYMVRDLWGEPVVHRTEATAQDQQEFAAASEAVVVGLDRLTRLAISDGSRDLAQADTYRIVVFCLLGCLLALVPAVLIYLARRMTVDIVRPLESLRGAALQLSGGELGHRVAVPASCAGSEVGRLAADFNAMAAVLDESHRTLRVAASHDELTGLPNRAEFQRRLRRRLEAGAGTAGQPDVVTVMFVDVDDFKDVNDSLGHAVGDEVLVAVGARLSECVRAGDVIARVGGDEFAVLLRDSCADGCHAEAAADRMIEAFDEPFRVGQWAVPVTVSIGVNSANAGAAEPAEPEQILIEADHAMYTSKRRGKGRRTFFGELADAAS